MTNSEIAIYASKVAEANQKITKSLFARKFTTLGCINFVSSEALGDIVKVKSLKLLNLDQQEPSTGYASD